MLSSFLFIIILDFLLQNPEITTGLQTHPDEFLPDLDLAEEIVLLDWGEAEATDCFQMVESSAEKVGLT